MVIGSTIDDVITVQAPSASTKEMEPEALSSGNQYFMHWCPGHEPTSTIFYLHSVTLHTQSKSVDQLHLQGNNSNLEELCLSYR